MPKPWLQVDDSAINRALFQQRNEVSNLQATLPVRLLVSYYEPVGNGDYLIFSRKGRQRKYSINLKNAFDNIIPHGLSHAPKGYSIIRQSSTANIIEGSYQNGFTAKRYLVLNTSADVTVEIEVIP